MACRTTARIQVNVPETSPEKPVYSGKYALSGIMTCGACGSLYRRCTWKRNGKTRIVWRCHNRLRNGIKHCTDSPTLQEPERHQALVAAINKMLYQWEYLLKPFEEADITTQYQNLATQQMQIDDNIVDLIMQYANEQCWDGETDQIRNLIEKRRKFPQTIYPEYLYLPQCLESYYNIIVRQILEKVTVLDAEHIMVTFKGGFKLGLV